jgi:hypothetical protein
MHTRLIWFAAPLLLATNVAISHAQYRPLLMVADREPAAQNQGSAGISVLAGLGLGLGGFAAGGLVGAVIASDCSGGEWCQLEGAFYGAAAGGTLGMALGVHLGNGRRGSLALDFLTGAAVWGAGIGIAAASDWDGTVSGVAFVTVPIVQFVSTIVVERAIGRSRSRNQNVTVSLAPRIDGGGALMAAFRF